MIVPEKSSKPALQSTTVQMNTIFTIAAMVAALDPSFFAVLGPKGYAIGIAAVAIANMILRFRKSA